MLKRYLLLVLVVLGFQPAFAKDAVVYRMGYSNFTLYVAMMPWESVVSVDRAEMFRRWDKKIELGLRPTIELSLLLEQAQLTDKKYLPGELVSGHDYILMKAVADKGVEVELFVDVNRNLMCLNGFLFKDDKAYRQTLAYVTELAGVGKAPDPATIRELLKQSAKKPAEK